MSFFAEVGDFGGASAHGPIGHDPSRWPRCRLRIRTDPPGIILQAVALCGGRFHRARFLRRVTRHGRLEDVEERTSMGFHAYSSPYDWSRIAPYKTKAAQVPGGIVDLSVGSPVDPVPQSVREALAVASDAKNAHGYPVTAGSGVCATPSSNGSVPCAAWTCNPSTPTLCPRSAPRRPSR